MPFINMKTVGELRRYLETFNDDDKLRVVNDDRVYLVSTFVSARLSPEPLSSVLDLVVCIERGTPDDIELTLSTQ